ncbi:MAG: 2-hydroxychromene-2-carboxylate isomerase [Rhodovibrionaceae bacterium]|nr:2-hydroxychromene-2-carboxylate isomerase [Rhodovibrionaceae bacterium]
MGENSGRIEFYFDFSSPYGYLGAQRIDELAASVGRDALWQPFLLGAVYKKTGAEPLVNVPLKKEYSAIDMPRSARKLGVPFVFPQDFPMATVPACRAFYWLEREDAEQARTLAKALYHAAFADGRNISAAESVLEVAGEQGFDTQAMEAALGDQEIKDLTREKVEQAIEKGVFGSPFLIVDGEPFWGHDRMEEAMEWARTGGW